MENTDTSAPTSSKYWVPDLNFKVTDLAKRGAGSGIRLNLPPRGAKERSVYFVCVTFALQLHS